MGFPVVLKIVSPEILHKTEAKGVLVGIKSEKGVEDGYNEIMSNAKKYNPNANLHGIQIQQMVGSGQEVMIGVVTDPTFGKLVAFGLGGVLVEILKDITFRLAPASSEDALSMLDGITAHKVLKGIRGVIPINREALSTMIQNVSQLATDFPEISEMDLNPVFATKNGAIAADIRIIVNFTPQVPRFRYKNDEIAEQMQHIMNPESVAVIGASSEEGKIGNSVMKNLINGGYKGEIYPIHPKADEIMEKKYTGALKMFLEILILPFFAIPAKVVPQALIEVGEKRFPALF